MDFKALFESLPEIIALFVPGYVFIKTFCFFGKSKSDTFEGTAVASVTISYVFNLVVDLFAKVIKVSDTVLEIIPILLAFGIALILVKLKTAGALKSCLKWIGKVSDSDNIWQDIFNLNKGSRIRCYSKFNNENVMIEGNVKYFDICEDGECSIALVNYVVTYDNGYKYELGKRSDEPILYLNTRNVHGLEVTYGQ